MNLLRFFVIAFVGTLTLWTGAYATTVSIDDSTDGLTVSLNGTDLTSFLINGIPPGLMVGSLSITGGLILTGAGCNGGPGAVECAVLQWDDPNIQTTFTNPVQTSYNSPSVLLDETLGTPGTPPTISDIAFLTITTLPGFGTQFTVNFNSDAETALGSPCPGITGCTDLGLETGSFQDISTALLTPVSNCIICSLPNGLPAGALTAQVRSGLENSAPEPATLALLGVGLAGLGFARRRNLK